MSRRRHRGAEVDVPGKQEADGAADRRHRASSPSKPRPQCPVSIALGSLRAMRPKTLLAPLLILLTFGLVACGGNGDNSSAEEGATAKPGGEVPRADKVRIVEFFYDPDPVTVQVGGKVI